MSSTLKLFSMFVSIPIALVACRTLDPTAEHIPVSEKSYDGCKNLGVVNIDWAWWGTSSEILNVLRNQVADKGGNLLVYKGGAAGFAYKCPENIFTEK